MEEGLTSGAVIPKMLDKDMGWREGTTDRHFRNHMGEYHLGSNSDCVVCTHPERSEVEQAYFTGGMTSESIADIVGCSESTVYHHLKHHLKPLVQKSAADIISVSAGKEIDIMRGNLERLNGELGVFLDDADRNDPSYVKNIIGLHKEVRETLSTMVRFQEKAMGETNQTIQADTVNILKVELAKESPEVWKRVRNKLLEEEAEVESDAS
jgi:predicted transcriptional regulator